MKEMCRSFWWDTQFWKELMNKIIGLEFDNELLKLYSDQIAIGRSGSRIQVSGLSSVNNIIAIRTIILDRKPRNTLEIGLAYGGSALAILKALAENCGDDPYSHVAIDPWQKDFDYAGFELVKRAGFSEKFRAIEGSSDQVLPELLRCGERFDLIYVDGSHVFENVFIDMYFGVQLLNANGVILFDDCTDPHVNKVIRFVKKNLYSYVEEIDIGRFQPRKTFLKKIANYFGYSQMKGFVKRRELPRPWDARFERF